MFLFFYGGERRRVSERVRVERDERKGYASLTRDDNASRIHDCKRDWKYLQRETRSYWGEEVVVVFIFLY